MKKLKIVALTQIILLVSASVAFAFILNGDVVSAAQPTAMPVPGNPNIQLGTFMKVKTGGESTVVKWLGPADASKPLGLQMGETSTGSKLQWANMNPKDVEVVKGYETQTKPGTLTEGLQNIYKGQGFGLTGTPGALLAGVAWAAKAYMLVKLIGPMLGLDEGTQTALEASVSAGSLKT